MCGGGERGYRQKRKDKEDRRDAKESGVMNYSMFVRRISDSEQSNKDNALLVNSHFDTTIGTTGSYE